ncbi:MAG: D-alanyl-D-alanine carboxypeptidase family protein [Alphaproteobacteria bacterium]|nr:D-alanyl-D-alanine carboxypeptidase family protein [Alphaproteobacteria bacterium]
MKTFSPVSSLRKAMLALILAICACAPAFAEKYASIVVDMNSAKVLHARNADEARYPASLTKVMTLYMVFDALEAGKLKLNERLPVSKAASRQQPSKLGLKAGSTIKVEDAIRALVTKSANDVAVVLAEKLAGSESKFAVKMTAKARDLGLENTTFKNASGLPDKAQVTTARDLAKLAEAMFFDHRDYYNYFSTSTFTWNKRRYDNHNTLLRKVDGVDGIKTGYTNASGYNLMASAERGGRRVIAVMLGGATGKSRDQHVADLLEAAYLEINGGLIADGIAGLRDRIASGERALSSADALAAAQLRRFADADAELADSTDEGGPESGAEDLSAEGDAEQPIDEGSAEAAVEGDAGAPAAETVIR